MDRTALHVWKQFWFLPMEYTDENGFVESLKFEGCYSKTQ